MITIDFNNPAHLAVVLLCVAALGCFSFMSGVMMEKEEDNTFTTVFIILALGVVVGLLYCFGRLTYNSL